EANAGEFFFSLVPFVEEELAGVGLFGIRQANDLRECVQREPLEQRDMQESTGDLGHILNGHVGSSSCHTSSRRRLEERGLLRLNAEGPGWRIAGREGLIRRVVDDIR